MPGFDGTGPQGAGSMTGGGRGYCAPNRQGIRYGYGGGRMNRRGFQGAPQGRGRGGFGFGRGRRGQNFAAPYMMPMQPEYGYITKDDELNALRDEAQDLKMMLSDVESRINSLEADKTME